jgi:hypothetical protein
MTKRTITAGNEIGQSKILIVVQFETNSGYEYECALATEIIHMCGLSIYAVRVLLFRLLCRAH